MSRRSARYTNCMSRYKLALGLACFQVLLLAGGCKSHPLTDYRTLDQAGMWSSNIEELKRLNVSDSEVAQLASLKTAGVSDDLCVALVAAAHDHQHPFSSADAAKRLNRAGFNDEIILGIAKADQLESLSGDAVMLRLIGLSDPTVKMILTRRMNGMATLSSNEIARLKNTELSERDIVARIQSGMTDSQADAEATAREKMQAHAGTGFVRTRGRRR